MKRRTIDRIVSLLGLGLSVFLFVTAALLNWGYTFANDEISRQLAAQKITFPAADSDGFKALPEEDQNALKPFAGMQLTTGEQAKAYADHYIGVHVKGIAGGKTYSEVSGAALGASAAAKADPTNTELATQAATLMGQRTTLFMGETLRGLLGFSFAFWQVGQIAMYAAWAALVGGILMLILSIMGFMHLRRTPDSVTV
ncbi:MAG: hypothetical protein EB043_03090 [Actinobacteria bacterium]|jgi:hypothetical protein|nr:hypothetical protein [Actinomycetota bacterium]NCW35079.1 hypothetical protein [Actinomycetota bacterium]NCZ73365.1 hypothetical protein [Actinomycetota bacterium]NDA41533.1 hypothetical protein [Actinomycetota bacterium]NDB31410.1 hypothetical protein [Actinomycetota bacterium]